MEPMNRNKRHNDWTDTLRDRLQDARLPLEDNWASGIPATPAPAKSGAWAPWGWALAGVAAVLAAVLLLRPAQPAGPEPVRIVETPAAGTPGPAAVSDRLVAQVPDRKPEDLPSRPSAAKPTRRSLPSPEKASVEEEVPGQVRNDSLVAGEDDETQPAEKEIQAVAGGQPEIRQAVQQADVAVAGDPDATWLDAEERTGRPRRPVSLRLQAAGPGQSLSLAPGGKASFDDVPWADPPEYGQSEDPHKPASRPSEPFPISVGVSAALPLSRSWTLAAGLDYTQRAAAENRTLHYLGLPLDLQYYFNPESRLRVWLGGGLKAEKCIYVSGAEPLRDPVLFSWNLQAGLDLRVLPGVRLYVAPAASTYLNHSVYRAGWDKGTIFSLRAGLSFDLK